ncbi:4-amino-4-deoxychorismate lyase [Alternaria panax]|uniref:4-amino-4-deoxychorismate lyase n=1 Tax=Alternaria panax TaxID=48097 RepID=A0AAD4F8X0_9PLEO|nr:4-amino-4-deoxychorismate lyase [Alternaria panax]
MSSETEFQLFTSLRYDPLLLKSDENSRAVLNFVTPSPFYMLAYHRDRMVEAAQHFDFFEVEKRLKDGKALHEELSKRVQEEINKTGKDEAMKLRLLFDKAANLTVDFTPIPAVPLSTLYPLSLDPRKPAIQQHPANTFKPSPLTGGALNLGPSDTLPASTSTPPPPPEWKIKLDTEPTPSSPFTLLKTTKREMYDQSRQRALPSNPAGPSYVEVMLYNEVNELTEGALTSLYLFRGGRWVTPPVGVPSGEFTSKTLKDDGADEGELRKPFAGRWGHSTRSAKVGAGGQRGTSRRWALGSGYCMEEPVSIETVEVGEGVWVSNGVRGFGFGRVVA